MAAIRKGSPKCSAKQLLLPSFVFFICAGAAVSPLLARDEQPDGQPGVKAMPAPAPQGTAEPKVVEEAPTTARGATNARCYTSQPGCSGRARFSAGSRGIGCTIWKQNGTSGRVNFTLPAGQHTYYNVIYGDTFSCVWIEHAPPGTGVQRNWIYTE